MSDKGERVNVYLSSEANEKRKQLTNFSAWVNTKLMQLDVIAPPEQPKIKENWCPECKAWSPDSRFCPYCSRKCETKER